MPRYYDGRPLDTANTALSTKSPAPAVRWLVENRHLVKGMKVFDYGGGKGRNARWLRDEGIHVYSYDPNHGSVDAGGWYDVSQSLPSREDKFDVFLSCFVLNVVPKHVENTIVNFGRVYPQQIHITRNRDLIKYVGDALRKGNRAVTHFYRDEFKGPFMFKDGIDKFVRFGTKTSRGFQRDVTMNHPWGIEHQTYGYKIFMQN